MFLKNIIYRIYNILNIPKFIATDNKVICILPILITEVGSQNSGRRKKRTNKKYVELARKILRKNYCKDVVLSIPLLEEKVFVNALRESQKINILDGKWLYKYLILESLKYVSEKQDSTLEEQEVSIMLMSNEEINTQNIIHVAQNVKLVNIITENIEKFSNIEEYLYNTYGIMLRVTNNKRAMLKSNTIINIDYTEEELNRYYLPKNAIIFNIKKDIKIKSKRFEGFNIKDYMIEINNKYAKQLKEYNIYKDFNKNLLYEGIIYKKDSYKNITQEIEKDNVGISGFIGENGRIMEKDFKKNCKIA